MAEESKDRLYLLLLILGPPLLLLVAAVWLAVAAAMYPFKLLYGELLKYRFWRRHGRRGRFVLFGEVERYRAGCASRP